MGTEYALVHDDSMEAFDLGKGPWHSWHGGVPRNREAVVELINRMVRGMEKREEALKEAPFVADKIWNFIKTHPGCRLMHDCGDDTWLTPKQILNDPAWFAEVIAGGDKVYIQVGERYLKEGEAR